MPEKITQQKVMEAVTELRAQFEKAAPDQEKIANLEKFLDLQEDLNQKAVSAQAELKKREEEFKERIDSLEIEVARSGSSEVKNYRDKPEYKALHSMIQKGISGLDAEQKALLRTDSDIDGGFLTTVEQETFLTKTIEEISLLRPAVRVRTIGSKSIEIPVRTSIPKAYYEGEAEQGQEDQSNYALETITAFRQTVTLPATRDLLMNASYNMESELLDDAMTAFAQGEGRSMIVGTGIKGPEGILLNTAVTDNARPSIAAGKVSIDDLILLTGDLKEGHNPMYGLNRIELAKLRTEKSTTGQFLWSPGVNGPISNTINGYPYLSLIDMPNAAANSYPVMFGDFFKGYTLTDRTGITIIRDEYTRKRNAIIEFTIHRYSSGKVTIPEAIKVLQIIP